MDDKYYFISYAWKRPGREQEISNTTKTTHPIEWEKDCNKKYGAQEQYILIAWQEITKEMYEKYNK